MYPSVHSIFRAFNKDFEGDIQYMYADVKKLVTIGVGNLIDPIDAALKLPFKFKSKPPAKPTVVGTPGAPATAAQITVEWNRIKADVKMVTKDGVSINNYSWLYYETVTDLEISVEAIDQLVEAKLLENEKILKTWTEFAKFDTWPADAQLALLSMAWALGPGKGGNGLITFPKFRAACEAGDFVTAAEECKLSEIGNAGLIPRNLANSKLFSNAAKVVKDEAIAGYNRGTLFYPQQLLYMITIVGQRPN